MDPATSVTAPNSTFTALVGGMIGIFGLFTILVIAAQTTWWLCALAGIALLGSTFLMRGDIARLRIIPALFGASALSIAIIMLF